MYKDYKQFQKDESNRSSELADTSAKLLKKGFSGFQSNRFGQIGELSTAVLAHSAILEKFFNEVVDEHANKLTLAVFAYKKQWLVQHVLSFIHLLSSKRYISH